MLTLAEARDRLSYLIEGVDNAQFTRRLNEVIERYWTRGHFWGSLEHRSLISFEDPRSTHPRSIISVAPRETVLGIQPPDLRRPATIWSMFNQFSPLGPGAPTRDRHEFHDLGLRPLNVPFVTAVLNVANGSFTLTSISDKIDAEHNVAAIRVRQADGSFLYYTYYVENLGGVLHGKLLPANTAAILVTGSDMAVDGVYLADGTLNLYPVYSKTPGNQTSFFAWNFDSSGEGWSLFTGSQVSFNFRSFYAADGTEATPDLVPLWTDSMGQPGGIEVEAFATGGTPGDGVTTVQVVTSRGGFDVPVDADLFGGSWQFAHDYVVPGHPGEVFDVLVKKEPVRLFNDGDLLTISNIGALKAGILAVMFEESNDLERAVSHWQQGEKILDDELETMRAGTVTPVPFAPEGPGFYPTPALY